MLEIVIFPHSLSGGGRGGGGSSETGIDVKEGKGGPKMPSAGFGLGRKLDEKSICVRVKTYMIGETN